MDIGTATTVAAYLAGGLGISVIGSIAIGVCLRRAGGSEAEERRDYSTPSSIQWVDGKPVRVSPNTIISVWDRERGVWTPIGSLSSTDYPNRAA